MKNRESSRKTWGKQILCIMLTAILLCGLSVSALAEEPEIKTYELVGVRFTIPAELKSTHGVVEYSAGHELILRLPTGFHLFIMRFRKKI